jgi:outer membrane protein assembly factor BamB
MSLKWVTQHNVNAADPTVSGDYLFATSGYGKGCMLVSLKRGRPVWQNESLASHYPSPVILDGCILGVDGNQSASRGGLKCLDLKTGRERWFEPTKFGSIIAANGHVIFLGLRGDLIIGKASKSGFELRSQCNLKGNRPRGDSYVAAPVLCRSRLYCKGSSGRLLCIDVSKKE